MSTIYFNGTIHWPVKSEAGWTLSQPEAVLINKGKACFGAFEELRMLGDSDHRDLGGKSLYPALIDAHVHVQGTGQRLLNPRLENCKSTSEVIAIVQSIPVTNGWRIARGWDQNLWVDTRLPTRELLDIAFPDSAIALYRVDGHVLWCNSRALEDCNVQSTTPNPLGGEILHDALGEPTGILMDEAMKLIEEHAVKVTNEKVYEQLRAGLLDFGRRGIAAVCDMGVKHEVWDSYKALYASEGDSLPICHVFCDMNQESGRALFAERSAETQFNDSTHERLRLIGPKLYLDGALGSRGAALLEEYTDSPGKRGLALSEDVFVADTLRKSVRLGLQVAIHAIGDAAFRRALQHYDQSGIAGSSAVGRIEHCQVAQKEDVESLLRLGIWPVVQPQFWTTDHLWAAERLGKVRMTDAYRWRSFLQQGGRLVGSSDSPVEEPNLAIGITAFQTSDREERLSYAEALAAYTVMPASMMSLEDAFTITEEPIAQTYADEFAL